MKRMSQRFRHAAVVGKFQSQGVGPLVAEIAQFIAEQGLEVSVQRETAAAAGLADRYPTLGTAELGLRCVLAVVIGGDGTMLGIARELAPHAVPLIGINQGRLGFITDVTAGQFREALAPMLAGDFEEEHRSMLEGGVFRDGQQIYHALSLNDVVVTRGASASMVELRIRIGGDLMANIRADGLIVSSPTGSTAYSLSAGGPILHPSIGGWVLVPIASHTLSNRPIVLPDTAEISIEIVAGRDATANFDMQSLTSLVHGDEVHVSRSAHRVRFLHPLGWSYYATLRRKLGWYEGLALSEAKPR